MRYGAETVTLLRDSGAEPVTYVRADLRGWCRRNPLAVTIVALMVLIAVAGPIAVVIHFRLSEIAQREKELVDQLVIDLDALVQSSH